MGGVRGIFKFGYMVFKLERTPHGESCGEFFKSNLDIMKLKMDHELYIQIMKIDLSKK